MTITEMQVEEPTGPTDAAEGFNGESKSQGRLALERFTHSWVSMSATILFVAIVVFSYVFPYFYKWKFDDPDQRAVARSAHPGDAGHWLGTDENGGDLFANMMRGTQRDFIIMIASVVVALLIGILIGALSGYFGGVTDFLLMRFVDIMLAVPVLVILIVVGNRNPDLSVFDLGIVLGLFGWMGLSRLVRAQFFSLKEREFVEASHAMGASTFRIIFRHLLPNTLSTILVFGTISAAVSIVVETSLTFLGVGVKPPDTSLGLLISRGVQAASSRPWLFYYPGILIIVIVLAVTLIGEGIRNAFDPKHNRVRD
jgi:ABC-type dipeptide/oligopeptide/nickel transport system permease subunit